MVSSMMSSMAGKRATGKNDQRDQTMSDMQVGGKAGMKSNCNCDQKNVGSTQRPSKSSGLLNAGAARASGTR